MNIYDDTEFASFLKKLSRATHEKYLAWEAQGEFFFSAELKAATVVVISIDQDDTHPLELRLLNSSGDTIQLFNNVTHSPGRVLSSLVEDVYRQAKSSAMGGDELKAAIDAELEPF